MITKEKLEKLHVMAENLTESAGDDKRVRNCSVIFQLLLTHVDDMLEEMEHLREENEALRYDLEDKKFEQGPRRRTTRERGGNVPFDLRAPVRPQARIIGSFDDDPPF